MSFPYESKLIKHAKFLRKNSTPQEKHLWYDFLNKYPYRFQRQKSIDKYVVDFYCAKANLAIELDRSQHYDDESIEYDKRRTAQLNKYGIMVLRFLNSDVDNNFDGVCEVIDRTVKERLS